MKEQQEEAAAAAAAMSDNTIPIIEPTIDYTKVPPIHQKRTISFINHFVVNTVSFLNKLALTCEEKLFEFENKLQRVEAAVVILESRFASIPGLEEKLPVEDNAQIGNPEDKINSKNDSSEEATNEVDETDTKNINDAVKINEEMIPISKHPVYEKYFKLAKVGVVKESVRKKMVEDGIDPDLLEDPQRPVPKIDSERLESAE